MQLFGLELGINSGKRALRRETPCVSLKFSPIATKIAFFTRLKWSAKVPVITQAGCLALNSKFRNYVILPKTAQASVERPGLFFIKKTPVRTSFFFNHFKRLSQGSHFFRDLFSNFFVFFNIFYFNFFTSCYWLKTFKSFYFCKVKLFFIYQLHSFVIKCKNRF